MESRVLAILFSSFLVVAFITDKAAGMQTLQCPQAPWCKKNKKSHREVATLKYRRSLCQAARELACNREQEDVPAQIMNEYKMR
ncbi:hypothetical protein ABFA07_006266 [Porites harrisoni]